MSMSSLVESYALEKMFSATMEYGMPIGRRLRIDRMMTRSLKTELPWMSILPTLTLGPSLARNVIARLEGGICESTGSTSANWRPRSARYS